MISLIIGNPFEDLLIMNSSASIAFTQSKIWFTNSTNSDQYSFIQLQTSNGTNKLKAISSIGRESQNGVLMIG